MHRLTSLVVILVTHPASHHGCLPVNLHRGPRLLHSAPPANLQFSQRLSLLSHRHSLLCYHLPLLLTNHLLSLLVSLLVSLRGSPRRSLHQHPPFTMVDMPRGK